ncbi:uncharacterized protein LOC144448382 [Glandiceps talaboti]
MVDTLKMKESDVKQNKNILKDKMTSLDKCVDTEKRKLKERVEIIVMQIKETEKWFSEQMGAEYEHRKTNLQAELKELERTENKLRSTREYASSITLYGGASQLMTAKRDIASQMQELMKIKTKEHPTYDGGCDKIEFLPSKSDFKDMTAVGALLGVLTDPSQCTLENIPKCVGSEQKVWLSVATRSRHGIPIITSEKEVTGTLTRHDGMTMVMNIMSKKDGTISLTTDFVKLDKECQVSVSIRGEPIQGVPITIKVEPLRFHDKCHSGNVKLCPDNRSANRDDWFDDAIVFTQRPLSCDEIVSLCLKDKLDEWYGGISVGFTSTDPDNTTASSLPNVASQLPSAWVETLNDEYLTPNNMLKYWVTVEGEVVYSINDDIKGVLVKGVDITKPLWGVMDLYGKTSRIELL